MDKLYEQNTTFECVLMDNLYEISVDPLYESYRRLDTYLWVTLNARPESYSSVSNYGMKNKRNLHGEKSFLYRVMYG